MAPGFHPGRRTISKAQSTHSEKVDKAQPAMTGALRLSDDFGTESHSTTMSKGEASL